MTTEHGHRGISRRGLLAGTGAVAAATVAGSTLGGTPAAAAEWWGYSSTVQAIDDGSWLYELTNLPDLGNVYVANPWTNTSTREARNRIIVVDADANAVKGEVDLGEGSAFGLTANPETNVVYTSDQVFTRRVYRIDGRTGRVTTSAQIAGGAEPRGLAVDTRRNKLWVALTNQGLVARLNGTTLETELVVDVGLVEPAKVAVNPVTNRVYASNANRRGTDSSITVIDGASGAIVASKTVDRYALGIAVNVADDKVYVSNYTSETLTVLNGTSLAVLGKAYVGGSPTGVEYNPVTRKVYITNFEQKGAVTVIDDVNHSVTRLRVRPAALGLTVNAENGAVYASSQTEGSVFKLRG